MRDETMVMAKANREDRVSRPATGLAAWALASAFCVTAVPASATVFNTVSDTPLSATPTSLFLGGQGNTFQFTAATTPSGAPGAAVATMGTALVTSFLGSVTDFGAGSTIGAIGGIYSFSAFPTASLIPFSAADDFIGLAFVLADGTHYGFAEVAGSTLVSFAYETTPGVSVTTVSSAAVTPVAAVPEPATMTLLAAGLAGFAAIRRRRAA